MRSLNTFAMEEILNQTEEEDEAVLYARMSDTSFLNKAISYEIQEQWKFDLHRYGENSRCGMIRVRKTIKDGKTEFTLTLKTNSLKESEDSNMDSTPMAIDEAYFEHFKSRSGDGMIKTRYVFHIEDMAEVWEVDVFKTASGKISNWVKLDLEWKQSGNRTLPPLPDELTDVINGNTTDPEEKAFISKLYREVFTAK
jgi:hypothetical protein